MIKLQLYFICVPRNSSITSATLHFNRKFTVNFYGNWPIKPLLARLQITLKTFSSALAYLKESVIPNLAVGINECMNPCPGLLSCSPASHVPRIPRDAQELQAQRNHGRTLKADFPSLSPVSEVCHEMLFLYIRQPTSGWPTLLLWLPKSLSMTRLPIAQR